MNTRIIDSLHRFENNVDDVGEVDDLMGKLSRENGKLSCIEKLRSKNRVHEMSREEFIQELKPQEISMRSMIIEIESSEEKKCKSEIYQ